MIDFPWLPYLLVILLGLGAILLYLISSKERKVYLRSLKEKEFVRLRWQEINHWVKLGGPSRFKQAVLEADKLLNFVLEKMGYQGSLAQKLKAARAQLGDSYSLVWQAHLVRNKIAHQLDYDLSNWEAQEVLDKFEKGLKKLGVL